VSSQPATRNKKTRRVAALALLVGAWLLGAPAGAHGPDVPGEGDLEARLDPLAPELAGLRVQVHKTAANQLVIENATAHVLEVLDERGVAFLRVGPGGVQGNLASPAWYRGFTPDVGRVPPDVLERARSGKAVPARWIRARGEPTWGWFDPRIAEDKKSHAGSADAHGVRRWEVPVRIDGKTSALRGRFVARPVPTGSLRARLRSPSDLAPGVRLSLLPGQAGSFFLESDSAEPVTVFGRDGEPFLRLGPGGVEANLHSATFAEAARLRGGASLALEPRADAAPRWERVSSAPRYGWVDPRTFYGDGAVPEAVVKKGARAELLRWTVPVRIGAGEEAALVRVEGSTLWEPFRVNRGSGRSRLHSAAR
jgi:hypothetical protein